MIGRRPTTSLRRPHHGDTNTQSVADVAKIVEMRNGVRPSSRAAGGNVEKSTDWPMPMHTRPTNRMRNARRSVAVMNGRLWHIVGAGTNTDGFARLARVRITIACQ